MQTGGQRCSCSNTLASGFKRAGCSYCGQQMAMFNYFHHTSPLPPSLPSSPPLPRPPPYNFLFFSSIFVFFPYKPLETEIFCLPCSRLTADPASRFCNINEIKRYPLLARFSDTYAPLKGALTQCQSQSWPDAASPVWPPPAPLPAGSWHSPRRHRLQIADSLRLNLLCHHHHSHTCSYPL